MRDDEKLDPNDTFGGVYLGWMAGRLGRARYRGRELEIAALPEAVRSRNRPGSVNLHCRSLALVTALPSERIYPNVREFR